MDLETVKQNLSFIENILLTSFDMEFYRCPVTNRNKCNITFSERDYDMMLEALQETLEILNDE